MRTRPFTPNRLKLAQAAQDSKMHPGTPSGCPLVGSIPLGGRYELRIDICACQDQPHVHLVLWDVLPGERPVPTLTRLCLLASELNVMIDLLARSARLLTVQGEADGGDR